MKELSKILILLLIVVMIIPLALTACNNESHDKDDDSDTTNDNTDDTPDNTDDKGSSIGPASGLQLIKDGKAQFRVVVTSGAGGVAMTAADGFIEQLRSLGVTVDDYVSDTDSGKVTECEIIIGTGAKNRPVECRIDKTKLGSDGYVIKVEGKRVVIAGATAAITKRALEKFISDEIKLSTAEGKIENLYVDDTLDINTANASIKIAGNEIKDYIICYDKGDIDTYEKPIAVLNNAIDRIIGKKLGIQDLSAADADARKIVFKEISKDEHDGFRVKVQGGNLIIECAYPNLLNSYMTDFVESELTGKGSNLSFPEGYSMSEAARAVKYSDFGAVGDGETNDFFNILRAHEYANSTGQKVVADAGKTYYISITWDTAGESATAKTIPVKTDVDWTGARFIIDDKTPNLVDDDEKPNAILRHRESIFTVLGDYETEIYSDNPDERSRPGNSLSALVADSSRLEVAVGQGKIEWLVPLLKYDLNYVQLTHGVHRDFVRFGNNQDSGSLRSDIMLVRRDGTVTDDTLPVKEFKVETSADGAVTAGVSKVMVRSANDAAITILGGEFITDAYNLPVQGGVDGRIFYNELWRGIRVVRTNTTLKNIDHKVIGEYSATKIELTKKDGTTKVSYPCKNLPYRAFIFFDGTVNSELRDSKLSGHIEDAEVINGTTWKSSMGSYDLSMHTSINTRFIGITQYREIDNNFYWGISASNGCKNMYFENCKISRVDAHAGAYNIEIKDSEIGMYINLVGGGLFKATNVTRYFGQDFCTLRNDYGATFDGIFEIVNCKTFANKKVVWNEETEQKITAREKYGDSWLLNANYTPDKLSDDEIYYYRNWDFGYTSYMPREIYIDRFTTEANNLYVFKDIPDTAFQTGNVNGGYQMTKTVYLKNTTLTNNAVCKSYKTGYYALRDKVDVKNWA